MREALTTELTMSCANIKAVHCRGTVRGTCIDGWINGAGDQLDMEWRIGMKGMDMHARLGWRWTCAMIKAFHCRVTHRRLPSMDMFTHVPLGTFERIGLTMIATDASPAQPTVMVLLDQSLHRYPFDLETN